MVRFIFSWVDCSLEKIAFSQGGMVRNGVLVGGFIALGVWNGVYGPHGGI